MAKIFKYFTQIFVVKEREMEIVFPTDVKHVAHVGWDGLSANAPSWMTEFKNSPDCSTLDHSNTGDDGGDSSRGMAALRWASQDFEHSMRKTSTNSIDLPPHDLANVPKKSKRKKATYSHMEATPSMCPQLHKSKVTMVQKKKHSLEKAIRFSGCERKIAQRVTPIYKDINFLFFFAFSP